MVLNYPTPPLLCFFKNISILKTLITNNRIKIPNPLPSPPIEFIMERGPRYEAYADLRDSKLRLRSNANTPPLPPKHHRYAN
ncbi:hypothetical protein Hanom_Chr07g00591141 [Helianthus anomalus]